LGSTPLSGFFFLVFVNRNRFQILCLKNLIAIKASNILDAIPTVEELGSLVLTALHSEITPILDREALLSSTSGRLKVCQTDSFRPFVQFYVEGENDLCASRPAQSHPARAF
jgi:hypothetical protein